jgi:hypothetical protein
MPQRMIFSHVLEHYVPVSVELSRQVVAPQLEPKHHEALRGI